VTKKAFDSYQDKARHIPAAFGGRLMDDLDRMEVSTWITATLSPLASKTIKDGDFDFAGGIRMWRTLPMAS